ncbi:hypothetical protein TURU_115586 [Turdus rufiventris]|nr:hypothetical protein TURU_115586 [Turdus rufiventris]
MGQVAAFDEQLHGTGVILFSRLHTCETLISQTPVYPLIYGSYSIIKHQHYTYACQEEGDQQDTHEPTRQQQQKKQGTRVADGALQPSVTFVVSVSSCSLCRCPVKLESDPENKKKQRSLPVSPERNSSGYSNPIIQP